MKTYQGSCHCGAVRFAAGLDLADGTIRCNCLICMKTRWWGTMVKPEDFYLLVDEEALEEYKFGRHVEKY